MNKDTTVILWLYHTDLAQEFYDLLKPLEGLINIHLCLCKDNDNKEAVDIFKELKNVKRVQYYANIGADIYSFLEELSFIETPYFLKLHSKKLKDKVVKIKMTEAIKSINKFCGVNDKSNVVKDEYVIQTMRYLELLKELKKSGNKKQKVI